MQASLRHSILPPPLPLTMQDHAHRMLLHGESRKYWASRGRRLLPPPVNAKVERLIQDWFRLVDTDESGALDISELEAALKVREGGRKDGGGGWVEGGREEGVPLVLPPPCNADTCCAPRPPSSQDAAIPCNADTCCAPRPPSSHDAAIPCTADTCCAPHPPSSQDAAIPCTAESLNEMMEILDFNRDHVIGWSEWLAFISYEVREHVFGGKTCLRPGGIACRRKQGGLPE